MDVFVECVVQKEIGKNDIAIKNIWIALCVVTGILAFLYLILFPCFVFALIMTMRYIKRMSMLYEYTYINGEITFTRMTTNRRKKLFTCTMEQVDQVCPHKSFRDPGKPFAVKRDFASGVVSDALYVMVVNGKKGKEKIFFEPNEEMLDAMRRLAPRIVSRA